MTSARTAESDSPLSSRRRTTNGGASRVRAFVHRLSNAENCRATRQGNTITAVSSTGNQSIRQPFA